MLNLKKNFIIRKIILFLNNIYKIMESSKNNLISNNNLTEDYLKALSEFSDCINPILEKNLHTFCVSEDIQDQLDINNYCRKGKFNQGKKSS